MYVRIDVIQPGELVLDQYLARSRLRDREVGLEFQYFGTSDLFDEDSAHGTGDRRGGHGAGLMKQMSPSNSGTGGKVEVGASVIRGRLAKLWCGSGLSWEDGVSSDEVLSNGLFDQRGCISVRRPG